MMRSCTYATPSRRPPNIPRGPSRRTGPWLPAAAGLLMACTGVEPAPQPPEPPPARSGPPMRRASPPRARPAPADTPRLSVTDIFGKRALAGTPAKKFTWSKDGSALYYLRPSPEDARVLDLWRLAPPDGKPERLLRAKDLAAQGRASLTAAQRAALERRRVRDRGITAYILAPTGKAVLIPYGGFLYHLDLATRRLGRVFPKAGGELDPRFSPDGRFVSFVRKGNLILRDLRTGVERPLTRDGTAERSYGVAEFVAQEELDRFRGYWWSPDGRHIALTRVDERPVQTVQRHRIAADGVTVTTQRYPAAGTANARVDLGVLQVATGRIRWIPFGPGEDRYLARVRWVRVLPRGARGPAAKPQHRIAVQWLSRDQRTLRLYLVDPAAATARLVLVETDPRYLNLHRDLRALPDGQHFLWSSERSGLRQILRLPWWPRPAGAPAGAAPCVLRLAPPAPGAAPPRAGAACGPIAPVTRSPDPVHAVAGVDPKGRWVYATVSRRRGLELHLARFPLEGPGQPEWLTRAPGWHAVSLNRGATHAVDRYSRAGRPPKVRLMRLGARDPARVLDPNPAPGWQRFAGRYESRFVTIPAADGTPLNGRLLLPPGRHFGEAAPPLPGLVYVYGGPHGQVVADRWHRMEPWHLYFAQRGFAVLLVDGRGTAHRGKTFEAALWRQFGVVDVADVAAAVRWLGRRPEVDPARIGLWGWSYGGFLTVMTALKTRRLLRAAAAVAPVTDWSLYDTAYTERYLGHPARDKQTYAQASPLAHAHRLQIPLLLVHGMSDDNVLLTHSLKLAQALQRHTRLFSMMLYPGKAHSIKGTAARRHLLATLLAHFQQHLQQHLRAPAEAPRHATAPAPAPAPRAPSTERPPRRPPRPAARR